MTITEVGARGRGVGDGGAGGEVSTGAAAVNSTAAVAGAGGSSPDVTGMLIAPSPMVEADYAASPHRDDV